MDNQEKWFYCLLREEYSSQKVAQEFYNENQELVLVCGRYEGIDERIKNIIDEEISIGDYIISGGELAALVIIDSIVRLIPGALGDESSAKEDSFMRGFLDYPQIYKTRGV